MTKGNFTRDEWNHLLCLFNISHFSSINSLEAMSKRTQEDAGEEGVTAKSKLMMNLVSRYSVRDPNVLASTASESPGKTRSESQNVPLSSLNVQQTRTVRLVEDAYSSSYSEWNVDKTWSSQEWKSGEMLGARTVSSVGGQESTHEADKFVIDDDTGSDTATESNLSLRSRSFLNRVDDGPFFKRCYARHRQTFYDSENVYVFDIGSICIHGKELLGQLAFHQKYRKDLILKHMFEMSEKLIMEKPDEIFVVSQINWEDSKW